MTCPVLDQSRCTQDPGNSDSFTMEMKELTIPTAEPVMDRESFESVKGGIASRVEEISSEMVDKPEQAFARYKERDPDLYNSLLTAASDLREGRQPTNESQVAILEMASDLRQTISLELGSKKIGGAIPDDAKFSDDQRKELQDAIYSSVDRRLARLPEVDASVMRAIESSGQGPTNSAPKYPTSECGLAAMTAKDFRHVEKGIPVGPDAKESRGGGGLDLDNVLMAGIKVTCE